MLLNLRCTNIIVTIKFTMIQEARHPKKEKNMHVSPACMQSIKLIFCVEKFVACINNNNLYDLLDFLSVVVLTSIMPTQGMG